MSVLPESNKQPLCHVNNKPQCLTGQTAPTLKVRTSFIITLYLIYTLSLKEFESNESIKTTFTTWASYQNSACVVSVKKKT